MARGTLDVVISDSVADGDITLVTECYNGYSEELQSIPDKAVILLKKGDKEKNLTVIREKGDECAFHYMEVSPQTAKDLDLKGGARYLLEYNEMNQTASLTRITVSRVQTAVKLDRSAAGKNRISVGYASLSQLGLTPDPRRLWIMKEGKANARLRFSVPQNELDDSFRVSSAVAARFGMREGDNCTLEYNQATRTLQCVESGLSLSWVPPKSRKPKAAAKKQVPPTAAFRSGTNLSKPAARGELRPVMSAARRLKSENPPGGREPKLFVRIPPAPKSAVPAHGTGSDRTACCLAPRSRPAGNPRRDAENSACFLAPFIVN
ncbi:hypothetical protein LJK87_24690 [Paenibacillus sp. P25]|nr:hypothetical protein LJK87_24690 [Paenibacillus sp. P25]